MRLINYINEEMDDYSILDIIQTECSEILKIYQKVNRVLYRGLKDVDSKNKLSYNVYKITPRTDRKPKDTDLRNQEIIDELFYEKFGWRPRAEGVFVSPLRSLAGSYGELGVIFPVNGFKYIWSKQYSDLYSDFFEELVTEYDPFDYDGYWMNQDGEKYDTRHYWNIPGFIDMKKMLNNDELEIKIKTNKYDTKNIKIKYITSMTKEKFYKNMENQILKVVNTYSNTGLNNAIKHTSEIMFKCNYYYFVRGTILIKKILNPDYDFNAKSKPRESIFD